MRAVLAGRVEKLETKIDVQPKLWITFSKFDLDTLRSPSNVLEYLMDKDFSKPDRETCRKMGQLNIEAVKVMRSARAVGIDFRKLVKHSVCLDDDSCYCEGNLNMTHDDWVKLINGF